MANEWQVRCEGCGKGVILDERSLGPKGIICPDCQRPLDPRRGDWVARNPHATWGDGFWIGHPMVPWLNYDEILDRQRIYDLARFKNEVLGLPTSLGEHVVTRQELEACCGSEPMAGSIVDLPPAARAGLVAGIDWGGGGTSRTVLVFGVMDAEYCFHVCRLERFAANEDPSHVLDVVAERCRQFHVRFIGADGGGNGYVFNRLLLERLGANAVRLVAVLYSTAGQEPTRDGALVKWTVNRSATIGALFTRVKKRDLVFPKLEDCASFLDEFACELAEYDDLNRTVRYTHPKTQPDDALHATNYALLLGIRLFSERA